MQDDAKQTDEDERRSRNQSYPDRVTKSSIRKGHYTLLELDEIIETSRVQDASVDAIQPCTR